MAPSKKKQQKTEAQSRARSKALAGCKSQSDDVKIIEAQQEMSNGPVAGVPKAFADLPGEIRNAIYRAICENIHISSKPTEESMTAFELCIDRYTKSRPFAMLRLNQQTQHEFFNVLFSSNYAIDSGNPFGMIFATSKVCTNVKSAPSQMTPINTEVTASYYHEDADLIEVSFSIHVQEGVRLTDESYHSIVDTVYDLFDTEDKFTVMQFFVAIDRIWRLPVTLNAQNWQESANVSNMREWEVENLLDDPEDHMIYVFRCVLQRTDDGEVDVTMDEERVFP